MTLQEHNSKTCEIEFVQKVSLKRYENLPRPGSLLLNGNEIEVRSKDEEEILAAVAKAEFSSSIKNEERKALSRVIDDCIEFAKSDKYVELANKFTR